MIERFDSKYDIDPDTGCWVWNAATYKNGYGKIGIGQKLVGAHRVSYELYVMPLRCGERALHRCDNPPCVNPEHLFAGSQLANVRDMMRKGRHARGPALAAKIRSATPRGERGSAAKLTDAQAASIRRRHSAGERSADLAREYAVSRSQVWNIVTNRQRRMERAS